MYASDPLAIDLDQTPYALDSTTIDLCLSLFPWARFRSGRAAVTVHTLLDLCGNIPTFIYISDGKLSDVKVLDEIVPEAGAFYVMDRGYLDFDRLYRFTVEAAFFVVRNKRNVILRRRYSHPVVPGGGVISDQTVVLDTLASTKNYPDPLRRIHYLDAVTQKRLVFLTNNFALPPLTIANIYRCRWQVELFFESLTWCTPLDVYEISRISCAESTIGGAAGYFRALAHRSTSARRSIHGAPAQACVAGNCFI